MNPLTLTVHRASNAPAATLHFTDSISELHVNGNSPSLHVLTHLVTFEADAIAELLFQSLPQATGNRVMARLLERYASQYLGSPGSAHQPRPSTPT
jgi:hypothetical protein